MKATPETAFDGAISDRFAQYEQTVRGHVRYQLVARNLLDIVTRQRLTILDVGGGSGRDTVRLAGLGHRVTLLEPAADQLQKARERLAGLSLEATEGVMLRQGTVDELIEEPDAQKYDLVMSHDVAMYLEEPQAFIDNLISLVKPSGHLSLLEKGFYGAKNRLLHEGKTEAARQLEQTGQFINRQDRKAWAFKPETLLGYVGMGGGRLVDWRGVRVSCDFDDRQLHDVSAAELELITEQEYQAGQNPSLRGAGAMLHVVTKIWR